MSKEKQETPAPPPAREALEPIVKLHISGDGIKTPHIATTIALDGPHNPALSSGTFKVATSLDWHQIGVRVCLKDTGVVLVVPYNKIDAIVHVDMPRKK